MCLNNWMKFKTQLIQEMENHKKYLTMDKELQDSHQDYLIKYYTILNTMLLMLMRKEEYYGKMM